MAIVYIGLGSNLGDRENYLRLAVDELKQLGIGVLKQSSIIETDPIGGPPDQEKFLNAVLKAKTSLSPQELLKTLKATEQKLGRTPTNKNGPRVIDLDILLYENLELNTPQLIIPHPKMLQRDFVVDPLKEIEPNLVKELLHAHY